MSTHATALGDGVLGSSDFDVAIIGAGLGGACAAIALARQGARVALLEAARMPRHKVCGEFLSSESSALFGRLDVIEEVKRAGAVPVSTARIVQNRRLLSTDLPAGALAISRLRLDQTLWRKAVSLGTQACDDTRVQGLETLRDGFLVRTTTGPFKARFVLCAAGRNIGFANARQSSRMEKSRHANVRVPPHEYSWRALFGKNGATRDDAAAPVRHIGFKTHFTGARMEAGVVELHPFDGGYCGLVRIENGLTNVCLLARYDVVANRSPQVFWDSLLRQMPSLQARLRGATPAMPWLATANVSFGHTQPVLHLLSESHSQTRFAVAMKQSATSQSATSQSATSQSATSQSATSQSATDGVRRNTFHSDAACGATADCDAGRGRSRSGAILQCGDASGFIHPLTGDGMAMAARGGELAAMVLISALRGGLRGEDVARIYEASWRREFESRLRWGARLQPLATSPRATSFALAVLNRAPFLARRVVALTRGS